MHYQKVLKMPESIPYLSVGFDVGADFTWMSIMLPNGILIGKPFKIIHSDPQSRELAISKIKEAQEMYSLESRCFLESTGIYHIPLLCFLRDKGFDCAVINPNILSLLVASATQNSICFAYCDCRLLANSIIFLL